MNAYTYINACDAIGPAIHKNGLFYGREGDFTRAIHEFVRFYGRKADFTRAVHEFECFYGRPIVSGQSGAGQPPSEVPPGHIALLHPARRRREEKRREEKEKKSPAVKLSAGNRKQGKKKTKEYYRINAEATTFATLARRAATLPLSAGWTRWVRSITAQSASRSMTIEVPV